MSKKKKIIIFCVSVVCIYFVAFFGIGTYRYLDYAKAVKASGGGTSEGGTISKVTLQCVLDSACSPTCTLCGVSCPMVTSEYATACAGYMELQLQSQNGTLFLAPPIGFSFKGGGTIPKAGDQFLSLNMGSIPIVIGIPGKTGMTVHKIKNWFDKYIIAGFSKK